MQVTFRTNELQQAFGDVAVGRKLWGQKTAVRYIDRVRVLQSAQSVLDLRQMKSLDLHFLKGGRYPGRHAIRIDEFYRIIILIDGTNVRVEEVSKHYD
jgi:plasmid maintenance system killer protein